MAQENKAFAHSGHAPAAVSFQTKCCMYRRCCAPNGAIDGVEMMLVGCKNICKLNVTNCPKIDQNAVIDAASELCDHYVSIAN
jgi:hypothetical protein